MKKLFISVIFAVLTFAAVSTVAAQESKVVSKGVATNSQGVKFADWNMTLVKSKPLKMTRSIAEREAHTYYFKAQTGQSFSAKLASKNPTVNFVIYDAEGTQIGDSSTKDRSWQKDLEKSSEYKIVVSTDAKTTYTLTAENN